jgi:hypothetical protein
MRNEDGLVDMVIDTTLITQLANLAISLFSALLGD